MTADELRMMLRGFEDAINDGRRLDALELIGAMFFKLVREQGVIPPKAANALSGAYARLLDEIEQFLRQEGSA